MFNGLGVQWAATLLGCVAALLVPIPIVFYIYGARLRARSAFAPVMLPPPSPETDATEAEVDGEKVGDADLHGERRSGSSRGENMV